MKKEIIMWMGLFLSAAAAVAAPMSLEVSRVIVTDYC